MARADGESARSAAGAPRRLGSGPSTEPLGADLLTAIARVNRWATRHAELEVPPAQGRLLALIASMGVARVGDLARADHCSQPTMTAQVQRLAERGLVQRAADPADARASLVSLTAEGTALLARMRAARAEVVEPILASLGEEGRSRLRAAVAALDDLLDAAGEASRR